MSLRLQRVRGGHRLGAKLKLALIRLVSGDEPPDVVKTMLYRPEAFGKPFSQWAHAVMRGPSAWSAGERELMAAFTSRLNECRF